MKNFNKIVFILAAVMSLLIVVGAFQARADTAVTFVEDAVYPSSYSSAPGQIYSATFVASVTEGILLTDAIEIPAQFFSSASVQIWSSTLTSGAISSATTSWATMEIYLGATDGDIVAAPGFVMSRKYEANTYDWIQIPVIDDFGTFTIPEAILGGSRYMRLRMHKHNDGVAYGVGVSFK